MDKEKIMELKLAMDSENKINDEIAIKRVDFEEQNKDLFLRQAKIRETIVNCKDILWENAEVGFKKDGIKSRFGGIGIRVGKLLEYDNTTALNWAKKKDLFLQLDKKAFENVAKTGEIDFVEIKDKVTVTFPKEIKLED